MQQWYQCPRCRAPVAFGARFCTYCGTSISWSGPQPAPPPPGYQQPWNSYQQPAGGYGRAVERAEKKTNPWLIVCIGLITVVFLVGGAILAFGGSNSKNQAAPQYTRQQKPDSTAQTITEYSGQQEPTSPAQTIPDYVQQFDHIQPPVMGSHGNMAYLQDNPNAKDVSFAALKSFILSDPTSEKPYLEGVADCVDFAEEVHNDAEQAGIKAAFVCISFEGEQVGHALDAFETTDKGLVYIDCTGQGLKSISYSTVEGGSTQLHNNPEPGQYDKIAYIEKGKQLGAISIDKAESLDYSFYVQYADNCQKLDNMIEDYNSDMSAFKQALGGRTVLAEPEYSKFKAWQAELDAKRQTMLELSDQLGASFKPLGIVDTVKIYW